MVGWRHQFNGHDPGQTPGEGEGQGGLASSYNENCFLVHRVAESCCSPQGCRESDTTWSLKSNNIAPLHSVDTAYFRVKISMM